MQNIRKFSAYEMIFDERQGDVSVIKFSIVNCKPCTDFDPAYERIAEKYASSQDVKFYLFNCTSCREDVNDIGITQFPTVVVAHMGKVVALQGEGLLRLEDEITIMKTARRQV